MNVPESIIRNISGDRVLLQGSSRQSWPQLHATLERLKAVPISQLSRPTAKIDLEQHADYLESN